MQLPSADGQAPASAQSPELDQQRAIADRFLQVLLRRPRTGTALDRVYGYHIQAGTLDPLFQQLQQTASAGGDDAAAHWMLLGLLQLQRGEDAAAADSLRRAEPLTEDAMASYYLGRALLMIGKTDAAAAAFERSIERGPVRTEALPVFTELGRIYGRAGEHEKAISVWSKLEELFPGDPRVGEQIARTLSEEGQPEAALERYLKLAEQSETSDSYRAVGFAISAAELKRRLGRDDEALADLEDLLTRLRPGSWLHSDVRRRIEAGFLRDGDYSALADYYASQLESDPNDLDTRVRLGHALAGAGRLNEAVETLAAAVERAPEDADVRLALIDVLRSAGRSAEVAEHLRTLSEQNPDNPDYYVQLGSVLLEDGSAPRDQRREAAAAVWQELAGRRPDDAVTIAQVADLMRRIEEVDSAIALYRRAVELAPDQPQYREYLGEYLHQLEREEEALAVWDSLAAGERRSRQSLIRRAEVFNTFGYLDRAIESIAAAAELDPTFAERLRFATLLASAKKHEDALAQLNAAENIAETPEEQEQILQQRIGVYASSGALQEQIAEAEARTASDEATAEDFRQLALMLDAAGRTTDAIGAIVEGVERAPRDVGILSVAAELYRQNSRFADAVGVYRQLATLDARFHTSYLQRVAELQMRMGQVDEALSTARELIAASPGSPSAYQAYANFCFQAGRDDEGIETLRRALRTAPRDEDARSALASALAQRFRTDEAIELYWQSFDAGNGLEDRQAAVRWLAPLYERKGELPQLVSRLEQFGRENSDARHAALLTAEAYETTGDLGSAKETLQPLLADNPRDAELLERMSRLSEAADESQVALEYQQQLVALADTPENRGRLLALMVDTGQIDSAMAALQRLRSMTDLESVVRMIDRTVGRDDFPTAAAMCREVLDRRSELWEIKTRLAFCLLLDDDEQNDATAVELAEQVRALQLPDDSRAASAPEPKKSRGGSTSVPPGYAQLPDGRLVPVTNSSTMTVAYPLARQLGLGRYSNPAYARSSFRMPTILTYDAARDAATAILLAHAAQQKSMDAVYEKLAAVDNVEESTDARALWDAWTATQMRDFFMGESTSGEPSSETTRIVRRLTKLDPNRGAPLLLNIVQSRYQLRQRDQPATGKEAAEKPLPEEDLDLLPEVARHMERMQTGATSTYWLVAVHDELKLAGRESEAAEITDRFEEPGENLGALTDAAQFFSMRGDVEKAQTYLDAVAALLRKSPRHEAKQGTLAQLYRLALSVLSQTDDDTAWPTLVEMSIDFWLAAQRQDPRSRSRYSSANNSRGLVSTYHQSSRGSYQQLQIQVPFADSLLDSQFAQQLYTSLKFYDEESPRRDVIVQHLASAGARDADRPGRQLMYGTLAAFASWWSGDAEAAFQKMAELSEQFPENIDVHIEKARLAAELNRPRESLAALDAVQPLDQQTLQTRELAAMNLAIQVGELERAKAAARRLFGMRLDSDLQLAMVDQLNRLGLQDMSRAMLMRMRRRGGQDERQLLSIAQKFNSSGDKEAAAEAAYQALQRLSSGQSPNSDYYRRQVVQLLAELGRLDKIIEQAERRAENAPNSVTLQSALAELYVAAGRGQEADKQLEKVAKLQPNDPRTLIQTAERLSKLQKYSESLDKYLAAFKEDPRLLDRHIYDLQRVAGQAKRIDDVYTAMLEWDLDKVRSYRLSELVRLYTRSGNSEITPAVKAFVNKVVETAPPETLGSVLRDLRIRRTDGLLESPKIAAAIERVFTSDDVFAANSQFWNAGSRSSSGELYGPLEPCLQIITSSEGLEATVRESLEKRKSEAATRGTAEALLIGLDVFGGKEQGIAERVETLIAADEKDADPTGPSAQLLWMIGQAMEDKETLRPTAIKIFEYIQQHSDEDVQRHSYSFGIGAKLVSVYAKAGEREKAVAELMKGFRETNHSRDQNNPGYGEYQDLEAWQAIAGKLVDVKAPLEAIQVYSHALGHPEKIAAAERWSSGRDWQERLSEGLEQALKSVTVEHRVAYLERLAQSLLVAMQDEEAGDDRIADSSAMMAYRPPLRLGALAPGPDRSGGNASIAAIAISGLEEHPTAMKPLRELDELLARAETFAEPTDRLHALGVGVLVATQLDSKEAAARLERLVDVLAQSVQQGKKRGTQDFAPTDLLPLYSIALVALESDEPAMVTAGSRLCDQLIPAAQQAESLAHLRVLATAQSRFAEPGSRSQLEKLLRQTLDAIAPASETASATSTGVALECLKIAQAAAESGSFELSLEAVQRALAAGPPLAMIGDQSAASAFVLPTQATSSASSSSNDDRDDVAKIATEVLQVIDVWRENGVADKDTFKVLKSVVLPPSRPGELFAYRVPVFSVYNTVAAEGTPAADSLGRRLAQVAVSVGEADRLEDELQTVRTSLTNPWEADVLLVQIAQAVGDPEQMRVRFEALSAAVDVELPTSERLSSLVPPPEPIYTRADTPVTILSDALLHALVPALDSETPLAAADELAMRVLGYAVPQMRALQQSSGTTTWFTDRVLERLAKRGAMQEVATLVELRTTLVEAQYLNYSGGYGPTQAARERQRLAVRTTEVGAWDVAADLIREVAAKDDALRGSSESADVAKLALKLADKNAVERYDFLHRLSFGGDGKQPFVDWEGYLLYESPPAELIPQTPALDKLRQISAADPYLPIVSTAMLLAQSAVETGNSDSLREAIAEQSGTPGDELDALAGLVNLYQDRREAAGAVLLRVKQHAEENSPEEQVQGLVFPTISAILSAQCLEADVEPMAALDTLETLQNYARRGQFTIALSCIDQLLARSGRTRAAGAAPGSPLEHWVVAPVPGRGQPVPSSMQPLYRLDEGSIATTSGVGTSALLLRYPVAGNFTYQHTVDRQGWGEANITYGGVEYAAEHWARKGKVIGLASRGRYDFETPWERQASKPTNRIVVSGDSLVSHYNHKDILTDDVRPGMPFLGPIVGMQSVAQFHDVSVTGDVMIPRSVDLIHPKLAGWGTLYYGGSLPDLHLPIPPDQDATEIEQRRQTYIDRQHEYRTWYGKDGHLVSGGRDAFYTQAGMRQINYLRPLCAGESLTYEFLYQPEKTEVHPTLGRVAVLLRPEGPRLRWLVLDGSFEGAETDPQHEAVPEQLLLGGDSAMPLRAGEWNTVELSANEAGRHVTVSLNGTELCRVPTAQPPQFGLLAEKDRTVDVRNATLTGPWPEELPDDLMEPAAKRVHAVEAAGAGIGVPALRLSHLAD